MTTPPATESITHILVVDDEPHIGRIIKTRLEQGPFEVTIAETGSQAIAALQRNGDYKLVVLDLMLPGMSGVDVLRTIRNDERWKTLACVVLTAAGHEAQFRQVEALGVSEFMTKPFSPRRLFARILALTGHAPVSTSSAPESAS